MVTFRPRFVKAILLLAEACLWRSQVQFSAVRVSFLHGGRHGYCECSAFAGSMFVPSCDSAVWFLWFCRSRLQIKPKRFVARRWGHQFQRDMAPKKAVGGAGNKPAQNYVAGLWEQQLSEQDVRKQLKDYGYKSGRISQLIKATRPAEAREGVVANVAVPLKRPATASGCRDCPEESGEEASRFCCMFSFLQQILFWDTVFINKIDKLSFRGRIHIDYKRALGLDWGTGIRRNCGWHCACWSSEVCAAPLEGALGRREGAFHSDVK